MQFGTDVGSRAIVAVDVVNTGSDAQQSEPLRQQAERRSGRKVQEHLFDGGFVNKDLIGVAESQGVAIYAPLPKNRAGQPCTYERKDSPGVAVWRGRMMTPEGQKIYHQRAATAETVNAETRTYRGLGAFLVRSSQRRMRPGQLDINSKQSNGGIAAQEKRVVDELACRFDRSSAKSECGTRRCPNRPSWARASVPR